MSIILTNDEPYRRRRELCDRAASLLEQNAAIVLKLHRDLPTVVEFLSETYGVDGRLLLPEYRDAARAQLRSAEIYSLSCEARKRAYEDARAIRAQGHKLLQEPFHALRRFRSLPSFGESFRALESEILDLLYEAATQVSCADELRKFPALTWLAHDVALGYNQLLEAKAHYLRHEDFVPDLIPFWRPTRIFPRREAYVVTLPDGGFSLPYTSDQELIPAVLARYGFKASSDASVVSTYTRWIKTPGLRKLSAQRAESSVS